MKRRSFFSKLFSPTVAGVDIADQSIKYAVLKPGSTGFKLIRFGAVPLPEGIIVSGDIQDPRRLSDILSDIRYDADLTRVRVSLPQSHAFIIQNAGLTIEETKLRAEALARSLISENIPEAHASMIVNFGEMQTDIAIVHEGKVYFTKSLSLPENPTQALMDAFSISYDEARTMKRTIGLSRKSEHEAVFATLVPDVSALAKQLDSIFIQWHTESDEKRPRIKNIILAGANAHISGLPEYLSSSLRTEVALGNPWTNMDQVHNRVPALHAEDALGFAAAFGLAMGE
jgi:Tfp pilus assembly PilM family ATPase